MKNLLSYPKRALEYVWGLGCRTVNYLKSLGYLKLLLLGIPLAILAAYTLGYC